MYIAAQGGGNQYQAHCCPRRGNPYQAHCCPRWGTHIRQTVAPGGEHISVSLLPQEGNPYQAHCCPRRGNPYYAHCCPRRGNPYHAHCCHRGTGYLFVLSLLHGRFPFPSVTVDQLSSFSNKCFLHSKKEMKLCQLSAQSTNYRQLSSGEAYYLSMNKHMTCINKKMNNIIMFCTERK